MMYIRAFSLVAVTVLGARAQEPVGAGDCLIAFNDESAKATDPCVPMNSFAVCLAKAAPGDKFATTAAAALEKAQAATQGCDLKVAPSMTVVDREVSACDDSFIQSHTHAFIKPTPSVNVFGCKSPALFHRLMCCVFAFPAPPIHCSSAWSQTKTSSSNDSVEMKWACSSSKK
jgi:hypothetical protein